MRLDRIFNEGEATVLLRRLGFTVRDALGRAGWYEIEHPQVGGMRSLTDEQLCRFAEGVAVGEEVLSRLQRCAAKRYAKRKPVAYRRSGFFVSYADSEIYSAISFGLRVYPGRHRARRSAVLRGRRMGINARHGGPSCALFVARGRRRAAERTPQDPTTPAELDPRARPRRDATPGSAAGSRW